MIGDRNIFVVRQERRIGSKEAADVGGVVNGRVEIGVIANDGRQAKLGIVHWEEAISESFMVICGPLAQCPAQAAAQSGPVART